MIDDLLALGPALQAAAALGRAPVAVRVVAPSWSQYAARIHSVADVVVVRAELVDHVPTALKVRALRAAGARPVVVADDPEDVHRARLVRCGAAAVLTRSDDLDDVVHAILADRVGNESPIESLESGDIHLSDRQLQIACLFAGHGAPSSKWIAQFLGLPESSVRTNLQRARRSLRAADRGELRSRLIEHGWMSGS